MASDRSRPHSARRVADNSKLMMRIPLALILLLTAGNLADAQLPQTRLYSIFPPGAAPGQVAEIRINTGADLDEVDRLHFNHPGIFATQKKTLDGNGVPQPVANTFRVAIESDVPPGRYEVRAAGRFGLSNPRPLLIDSRPALTEAEPNNTAAQAQAVALGSLVDGQINGAGDVDYVRFSATQGQRIVIDCLAERINSRLNPRLTILDADDKPIAFARNEYGRDPFLVFDVPADGDYFATLHDETFSGGGEHIYRLQLHTGPHVRFALPPAGLPGTTARVALYGYNLPGGQRIEQSSAGAPLEKLEVDIAIPAQPQALLGLPSIAAGLDLFSYQFAGDTGAANPIVLGLASAPVSVEQEPNDDTAAAQSLTVPVELAGQFAQPGDIDRYRFEGTKGQELWIEVIGQRSDVRLDPALTIEQLSIDAAGVEQAKAITTQDDTGSNLAASVFDTTTDDPAYKFVVPETGAYRLTVTDRAASTSGDPSLLYRLVVRPVQPDFRLVAVPAGQMSGQTWSINPRRGDHFTLDVLAFRRDGFEGAIEVRPVSLPAGVTTAGTVIREKETTATLVLTTSESPPDDLSLIKLQGSGRVGAAGGDVTVEHPVRPGTVVWSRNGNTPARSQLESQLLLSVNPELAPYALSYDAQPTVVHQGRQLLLPMTLTRRSFNDKLTVKFSDVAKKAKVEAADVVFDTGQTAQTCRLYVAADAPPGQYVLGGESQAQVPYVRNPQQVERLAAAKTLADQEALRAKTAADEGASRLAAQVAALQQADAALQQAQAAQATAEANATQVQQAVVAAKQANEAAVKLVATLTEELKQVTATRDAAVKAAADSAEEQLKTQAEQASKAVEEKQAALTAAQQAQAKAQQQVVDQEAATKPVLEALAVTQQATAQAQTTRQAAEALKVQLEARSTAAAAVAQSTEAARAAAEKAATDAANAAKPTNIAVNQPLPPIILTIKPAPVALEAKPAKGDIKAGEAVEVAVTIKRQNEFAGPVKLSLVVPPGVAGVTAGEVEVAADAGTGVLSVSATADAPEGDIAHLVVRATADFGGEAMVEVPVAIKVTK